MRALPGGDGVDADLGPEVLRGQDARRVGGERLAEGRDVGLGSREAGGALAPVALEVIGGGVEGAEQVEARDRAAGARALVVFEGDQHAQAVVALGDAGGDDADHARVPALGGEDVGGGCACSATWASASKRIRVSTSRRSVLLASSSSATARARSGSSVSSSSRPASAR